MRIARSLALGPGVLSLVAASLFALPSARALDMVQTPTGPGFLIYGNYCGPGNRGPRYRPIDALDLACAHHDACWPSAPGALPACACNERLHLEAGLVARKAGVPVKTRDMARFISDFATTIPCEESPDGPPTLPGIRSPVSR